MGTDAVLEFIDLHKNQLISSGVPQHLWKTLYRKLKELIFDAGSYVSLLQIEDSARHRLDPAYYLKSTTDISKDDENAIFLIDHAWTFQATEGRKQLLDDNENNLRERLGKMFLVDETLPRQQLAEEIFDYCWKYAGTYSIASNVNVENQIPLWYIMDEIGTAVQHNDAPNCRIIPFMNAFDQTMYCLLFPITNIDCEETLHRDFAEHCRDPVKRSAALIAWQPKDFTEYGPDAPIQDADYYLSGHIKENLPLTLDITRPVNSKYKVFSQYHLIYKYLTDERFELVDTDEEADIVWYIDHFRDFDKLSATPNKIVNQFPYEYVLTVKDLLCMTCRRYKTDNKNSWFPVTYNINIEIQHFISCFQERDKKGLDNYWICKPYNLARGLDMYITNNLVALVRMAETGPKIVQKYITNPVLFYRTDIDARVKFDIRYVLLLRRVQPLEAYIYKQFFLRFANKSFGLTDFDVYDKHFTVMNYQENMPLSKVLAEDFKILWAQQYSNYPWEKVEQSIIKMFKEIFESAVLELPPCGIAESPQSRSLYAADLMLEWTDNDEVQPKILEINYAPDCKRACEYYPDFYNNIFKLLFLDEEPDAFYKL